MRAIRKDFYREIRGTKSRFLSILILVALAVTFLSGLKATAPDMKHTCDTYLDAQNFMDIQVLSTLGLTGADIQALQQADGVCAAEGAFVIDAFAHTPALDIVTKVTSMPEMLNLLTVDTGRLPKSSDECVVDRNVLSDLSLQVGDTVELQTEGAYDGCLAGNSFTIVGEVTSPYYISVERGTSSLGTGRVSAYVYLPAGAFDMDYYTAAYLTVDGAKGLQAFSDEYNDRVDHEIDMLTPLGEQRALLRHDTLVNDAQAKIDDAQDKLDDVKADTQTKLFNAWTQLADARAELDNGWKKIADSRNTLARETADAQKKIDDALIDLTDAQLQLDDGEGEYADGILDYEDGVKQYEDGLAKYEDGLKEYEENTQKLDSAAADLWAGESALANGSAQLSAGRDQFAQITGGVVQLVNGASLASGGAELFADSAAMLAAMTDETSGAQACAMVDGILAGALTEEGIAADLTQQLQALADGFAAMRAVLGLDEAAGYSQTILSMQQYLVQGQQSLDQNIAAWNAGYDEYLRGKQKLKEAKEQLDEVKVTLDDTKSKLDAAEITLAESRAELDNGWKEFYDGLAEVEEAKATLAEKVADAKAAISDGVRTLRDGEVEYNDGFADYRDGKAEANEKIADAEGKLADARRKVADIKSGEWYILSRDTNPGYLGFGQDADRMANLASVFPILFFLVAALVCLTTMTRMVEDQRTQIGCMKALGYTRWTISRKYLGYGLLPSVIGGVLGLALGYTLFPSMIFTAYQIMYQLPDIELHTYPDISLWSLLAAVACTTLSSLAACLATLSSTPANLMRPKAPKAGKRVFLEYIRPIWRRLSFNRKVTARNLFRYQKRFWMTVIGIGGCTALIIAGFGLRSSLLSTMDRQYSELYHYTAQLDLQSNVLPSERVAIDATIADDPRITASKPCNLSSMTAESDVYSISVYLEAMDSDRIGDFVTLQTSDAKEPLALSDDGVIIDEKLAELLKVGVGDSFTLDGDSRVTVTVAGITEHYLAHFCYMTPAYYEQVFGKAYTANAYLLTLSDSGKETCDAVFSNLMSKNGVAAATRMLDTRDTYQHSMERIDFVVVIVILSAAALALVVLYNLSNINITERKRELATIKVLGFYDREVSAYVNRENVVLTTAGIGVGILMGHWLHAWLVRSVEIDLMMFGRETDPWAYFWAAVLTAGFSLLVNGSAFLKMRKIDMVESLKSAE